MGRKIDFLEKNLEAGADPVVRKVDIPPLTAAVVTFNSEVYIRDCLASLRSAGLQDSHIIVIDDGSTDATAEIVTAEFPAVRFLTQSENMGHSQACNRAIREAATPWVVLIDHDTVVDRNWLSELIHGIEAQPQAAAVIARTIFESDRETIHSDGGFAHFIGNMILLNGFSPLRNAGAEMVEIGAAGTTAMAVSREWAMRVGGFDEDFFIYLNDFEFSLRLRMAGGRLFCAPLAIIYHKGGTPDVSFRGQNTYPPRRAYLILRNRWFTILKLYNVKTLLFISPALLLYESLLLALAIRRGVWQEYGRAWAWLIGNFSLVLAHRRKAQSCRRINDSELLSSGPLSFVPGVVGGKKAQLCKQILDGILCGYWRIIVRFL